MHARTPHTNSEGKIDLYQPFLIVDRVIYIYVTTAKLEGNFRHLSYELFSLHEIPIRCKR